VPQAAIPNLYKLLTDPTYGSIANIGMYVITFMAVGAGMVHLAAGIAGNWSDKKKQGMMKTAMIFGLLIGLAMSVPANFGYLEFSAKFLQWSMLISIPFVFIVLFKIFRGATDWVTQDGKGSPIWAVVLALLGTSGWVYTVPQQIQEALNLTNFTVLDELFPVIFGLTLVVTAVLGIGFLLNNRWIREKLGAKKTESREAEEAKGKTPEEAPEAKVEPAKETAPSKSETGKELAEAIAELESVR